MLQRFEPLLHYSHKIEVGFWGWICRGQQWFRIEINGDYEDGRWPGNFRLRFIVTLFSEPKSRGDWIAYLNDDFADIWRYLYHHPRDLRKIILRFWSHLFANIWTTAVAKSRIPPVVKLGFMRCPTKLFEFFEYLISKKCFTFKSVFVIDLHLYYGWLKTV